jgi:hypothetical protein
LIGSHGGLFVFAQAVPRAAHRVQQGFVEIFVDRLS